MENVIRILKFVLLAITIISTTNVFADTVVIGSSEKLENVIVIPTGDDYLNIVFSDGSVRAVHKDQERAEMKVDDVEWHGQKKYEELQKRYCKLHLESERTIASFVISFGSNKPFNYKPPEDCVDIAMFETGSSGMENLLAWGGLLLIGFQAFRRNERK